MRHPTNVANKIAEIVPGKYKSVFKKLSNDFSYKAPEQWPFCFFELSKECNRLLNPDNHFDENWKLEMISILTNKTKEVLLYEAEKDKISAA